MLETETKVAEKRKKYCKCSRKNYIILVVNMLYLHIPSLMEKEMKV